MEKQQPTPPIEYPTVEVPGRGRFIVKFDLLAEYTLDSECGMDATALHQKLQEWMPKEGPNGERIPGRASPAFLLKVLSACIWSQAHMTPEELASAFQYPGELKQIAPIIMDAFAKTQWSAQLQLRETATPVQEQRTPTLN